MKYFIRILSVILTITAMLLVTSCSLSILSAPEKLQLEEDNTLYWNSVNGAKSYAIAVDGLEKAQTSNTKYNIDSLNLTDGQQYSIQIKAIGDGYRYENSDYSKTLTFVYHSSQINNTQNNNYNDNNNYNNNNNDNNNSNNNDGTTGQVIPGASNFEVINTNDNKFYKAHKENVTLEDKFTDGKNNYYYYYLGYLENFPLVFSTTKEYNSASGSISFSESVSAETQESIETAVSNSITETSSTSTSFEKGGSLKIGKEGWYVTGEVNFNVTDNWEKSQSSTTDVTHSVAESWAESTTKTITQNFDSSAPSGYYRYVQYTKKCDIYALVVYNKTARTFSWTYLSYAEKDAKNIIETIEYSPNGIFASDRVSKLEFDTSLIDKINVNETLTNKSPTTEAPTVPISIDVNKHLCATDKSYSLNTDGIEKDGVNDHSLFEMGHLVIYGCKETSNNVFKISEADKFNLEYIFDEDPDKLPNSRNNELYISNDSTKSVEGTDIQGEAIGYGAYSIKIIRKDGSTMKSTVVRNFMQNKDKGSVVNMLASLVNKNELSDVAKIEITIVYELYFYASIFDHHHTNWRSDYTLIFE